MANLTLEELRQRIREDLEDYPSKDTLGENITADTEEIKVTLGKRFEVYSFIQIGTETMQVYGADENANTVAVSRGMRNTTAATHNSGASITVNALFPDSEINSMIREGLGALYPKLFRVCEATATALSSRSAIFTIPEEDPCPMGLSQVLIYGVSNTNYNPFNSFNGVIPYNVGSDYVWAPMKNWNSHDNGVVSDVNLDRTITVQFKQSIDTGFTLRAVWMAPWEALTEDEDETTLDEKYLGVLNYYVCGRLGEKRLRRRLRFEGHSVDADPSKSSAADILGGAGFDMFRFEKTLEERKMAPLPFFMSNQHIY